MRGNETVEWSDPVFKAKCEPQAAQGNRCLRKCALRLNVTWPRSATGLTELGSPVQPQLVFQNRLAAWRFVAVSLSPWHFQATIQKAMLPRYSEGQHEGEKKEVEFPRGGAESLEEFVSTLAIFGRLTPTGTIRILLNYQYIVVSVKLYTVHFSVRSPSLCKRIPSQAHVKSIMTQGKNYHQK